MPSIENRTYSTNSPSHNVVYSQARFDELYKRTLDAARVEAAGEGITNGFVNFWKSLTGSGMTNAARESAQMEQDFNASQATIAFQRQLEMDNTKMQRAVADYKAAGLNPYALAGQSVSSPAVQSASSSVSSPASPNLSAILELVTLPSQLRKMKAERDLLESEKNLNDSQKQKVESETAGQNLSNTLFLDTLEIKKVLLGDEHDAYQWRKDVAQRQVAAQERGVENQATANTIMQQQANAYTASVDAMMELVKEQSMTEGVKREELRALAREANASADYKAAMRALDENIKKSQDQVLQEDLKIAAAEARLKNGVYTEDYIKALGQSAHAEADMKQALAEFNRGDYHAASKTMQKMFREQEKQGTRGTWSVGSPYFSMSETAPSGLGAR